MASVTSTALIPLTDRPDGATIFRMPGREMSAADFLGDVVRVAQALPDRLHVVNLCQDRYRFSVGLAAAVLRGQVSLLSGDPSDGLLLRLAREYPGAYALTDAAGDAPEPPMPSYRIACEAGRAHFGPPPVIPADQPVIIALTSGTTGQPSGTRKSWGELVARSRAAGLRFAMTEAEPAAIVGTVPAGHMYGLETTVLLPLHAAASVWCGTAFYPADVAAAMDWAPVRATLVTTPLHLRALFRAVRPSRPPARVISATAPLERSLAEQVEQAWGATVLEIFGATEVGSIASRRTVADDGWYLYPSVGLSEPDAAGISSISAPGAEARLLGDFVRRTEDGRSFTLVGRTADLVKVGGRRASIAGLSRILTSIEGVRDGVFIAPDDLDGDPCGRLVAVAVAPTHSVASLMLELRCAVDPLFLPRPLILADALPRNPLGKLPRAALLAAFGVRMCRDGI